MSERGFIQIPLMGWAAVAGFIVISLLTISLRIQSGRLAAEKESHVATKAQYATFVSETKRLGEAAKAKADATAKADKLAKEKSDAKQRSDLANLADAYRRMRDSRAGPAGSLLPAPAPGAASPDRATFNRAELDRALRDFDTEVAGIVVEGDQHRIGLDTAKQWAQQ